MMVPRKGETEGRWQLLWIWSVEGVRDDEDEVVQDGKFFAHMLQHPAHHINCDRSSG